MRPEIELRNYQDFALPAPATDPTAEDIAGAVADLRRSHATWKPVERSAAVGDRAQVEIAEIGPEGPAEARKAEIEVGATRYWDELSAAITGLAAGQSGRFRRQTASEAEGETGVEKEYEVRVAEVQEAELPELDDEWVKHFGRFENVAEFEADVEKRIRNA